MKQIGIKLADGSFYPIMEDGKSCAKNLGLTTVSDNQTRVIVDLYRSKTGTMEDAEYVDSIQLDNLNAHPNGSLDINLNIGLDENGKLHAKMNDPETGNASGADVTLVSRTLEERLEPTNYEVSSPVQEDGSEPELGESLTSDEPVDGGINLDDLGDFNLPESDEQVSFDSEVQDDQNQEVEAGDDISFETQEPETAEDSDSNAGAIAAGVAVGAAAGIAGGLYAANKLNENKEEDSGEGSSKEPLADDFNADDSVFDESMFDEPSSDDTESINPDEEISIPVMDDNTAADATAFTETPESAETSETLNDSEISNDFESPSEDATVVDDFSTTDDFGGISDGFGDSGDDPFAGMDFDTEEKEETEADPNEEISIPVADDETVVDETVRDETVADSSFDDAGDFNLPESVETDESVEMDEPVEQPSFDTEPTEVQNQEDDFNADTIVEPQAPETQEFDTQEPETEATDTEIQEPETTEDSDSNAGAVAAGVAAGAIAGAAIGSAVADNNDETVSSDDSFGDFDLPDFDDNNQTVEDSTVSGQDTLSDEEFFNTITGDEDYQKATETMEETSDFGSADTTSAITDDDIFGDNLVKDNTPSNGINFNGLYDSETENGGESQVDSDEMDKEIKKKTKVPVIICVICAIICLLATAAVLFFIPSKYNILSKNKTEKVEETVVVEEEKPAEPEIVEAKEDEIVVVSEPEKVIPEPPKAPEVKPKNITYKIKWGDTLWDIADAYYKNPWKYKYIARYNGIKNPDYIISGTTITIPAQ